ncbi:MAG TPA: potassium-transporting ATPase subunit KdpC [Blastocatellia bacterium]
MTKQIYPAIMITLVLTLLLGVVYPVVITGIAHLLFPHQADGSLKERNGKIIGSELIGQSFTGPGYFHSRPSAAIATPGPGNTYDPTASNGSNLGPTNQQLFDRIKPAADALHAENPNAQIPVDLVTTSASGLDPHITPAGAEFQVPRVAAERGLSEDQVRRLVADHTDGRQLGFLGEPRVNVLLLNLALDDLKPMPPKP